MMSASGRFAMRMLLLVSGKLAQMAHASYTRDILSINYGVCSQPFLV